ncbi:hypothetical protein [Amycolatopsis sp. NPDC059657]|uniref:hypothetical protein n=1 Tax=Amycolatopsis sp. NPDC059657 TaxID=3346899 RepID=UPI00366B5EE0
MAGSDGGPEGQQQAANRAVPGTSQAARAFKLGWFIPAAPWRKAINAEPYVPNLKTLREKIDQDTILLASLNKNSDAYRRLQTRITDQTTQLLDGEDTLERRRQQLAAEEAIKAMPRPATEASAAAWTGLFFTVPGLLVGYFGWGTWWLLLAAALLVFGVPNLVDAIRLAIKNS